MGRGFKAGSACPMIIRVFGIKYASVSVLWEAVYMRVFFT
jgi:hypothetical protein